MAYTTDRSWVDGEIVTKVLFNRYLRDNMKWLSTDKPMYRGYMSTAISHSDTTYTDITNDTERFDNAGMHSTTTNTQRVTVQLNGAGKYLVGASLGFVANATGELRGLRLKINATEKRETNGGPVDATLTARVSTCELESLAVSDYFIYQGVQDSGGSLDTLTSTSYSSEVWGIWVGF